MIVINPETRLSLRHLDVLCRALNGYCWDGYSGFEVRLKTRAYEYQEFRYAGKQEALKVLLALVNQQAILPDRVLQATTARTNKTCFVWKA